MYTVANVEKFFADQLLKGDWIVKQEIVQAIVARARENVDAYGFVLNGTSWVFGGDKGLMASFDQAMGCDREHSEIASTALRKRAEARAA